MLSWTQALVDFPTCWENFSRDQCWMTIMLGIASFLQSSCFTFVRDSGNVFYLLRSGRFYAVIRLFFMLCVPILLLRSDGSIWPFLGSNLVLLQSDALQDASSNFAAKRFKHFSFRTCCNQRAT